MKSTPCVVRAALQTTYVDGDLPSEIRVTYPPHPLAGQDLKVIGRQRSGRQLFWCVVLPDGSHAKLPSFWTDHSTIRREERSAQIKTRTSPHALRELIHLLESLVSSQANGHACPKDPLKGGGNGRAIGTVRSGKEKLAKKTVAVSSARDPAGGNRSPSADGDESCSSCQGRASNTEKGERR